MLENFQQRGLIYRNGVHLDTPPAALREVAHLDTFDAPIQQENKMSSSYHS